MERAEIGGMPRPMRLALLLVFLVSAMLIAPFAIPALPAVHGAEWSPHPHRGIIKRLPFGGKPDVKLSAQDLLTVDKGDLWMKAKEVNQIGTGVAVSDIAAPPRIVFDQISDLRSYVGKAPLLKKLNIYETTKKWDGTAVTKAEYIVSPIPGFGYTYYVQHFANKDKGSLLFYLDYDRKSDFDDLQGKWYVEPHPRKEGWSRVYYQCDLKLPGYMPQLIKTFLTKSGLSTAVAWVKRESEKEAGGSRKGKGSSASSIPPGGAMAPSIPMEGVGGVSAGPQPDAQITENGGSTDSEHADPDLVSPRAEGIEDESDGDESSEEAAISIPRGGGWLGRRPEAAGEDSPDVAAGFVLIAPMDWLAGAFLVGVGMSIAGYAACRSTAHNDRHFAARSPWLGAPAVLGSGGGRAESDGTELPSSAATFSA